MERGGTTPPPFLFFPPYCGKLTSLCSVLVACSLPTEATSSEPEKCRTSKAMKCSQSWKEGDGQAPARSQGAQGGSREPREALRRVQTPLGSCTLSLGGHTWVQGFGWKKTLWVQKQSLMSPFNPPSRALPLTPPLLPGQRALLLRPHPSPQEKINSRLAR